MQLFLIGLPLALLRFLPLHPPSWSSISTAPTIRQPLPIIARSGAAARASQDLEYAFAVEDEDEDEDEPDDQMEAMEGALTDRPASNLTVAELQAQLKQLGQRHTGTKSELVERIQLMQRKR